MGETGSHNENENGKESTNRLQATNGSGDPENCFGWGVAVAVIVAKSYLF